MRQPQRTILVIGSGLALVVLAITLNRHLAYTAGPDWFEYSPDAATYTVTAYAVTSRGVIWREAAVWLGAIAAWSGFSLWLHRHRPSE